MKRSIAFAAGFITLLATTMNGFAVIKPSHQMGTKEIDLNGATLSKPVGFTYSGTVYMPIWYVMQTLSALGIKSHWDGHNWMLTTPSTTNPDFANINAGNGSLSISINGKTIKRVVGIADLDPSSKTKTMFMPAWYIMDLLQRLNVGSNWDGTKWDITTDMNTTLNQPEDVVNFVDSTVSNLSADDDITGLDHSLSEYGYVTQNYLDEDQQILGMVGSWSQYCTQNNISEESQTSFDIVKEGEVSANEMVIETTETDTITYTDNTTKPETTTIDWDIVKNDAGLWQVDGFNPVTSGQTGTGSTNGSSTTNSSPNSTGTETNTPAVTN